MQAKTGGESSQLFVRRAGKSEGEGEKERRWEGSAGNRRRAKECLGADIMQGLLPDSEYFGGASQWRTSFVGNRRLNMHDVHGVFCSGCFLRKSLENTRVL